MIKLKSEFLDTEIWVPFVNANIVGRFIPEGLYVHLNNKYPELFEIEEPKAQPTKEKKEKNDLYKSHSISSNLYDSKTEQD